jgi:hypothetical protein
MFLLLNSISISNKSKVSATDVVTPLLFHEMSIVFIGGYFQERRCNGAGHPVVEDSLLLSGHVECRRRSNEIFCRDCQVGGKFLQLSLVQ